MSTRLSISLTAALLCVGVVSAQSSRPATTRGSDQKISGAQEVSVSGCVQKEVDVLKHDAMPGNMGMGDEFVLTRASLKTVDAASTAGNPETAESGTAAQAASNFGKVYRVTGDKENELKTYVGQRVEIVGTFKHPEDATREIGAIGTSGRMPAGDLTAANTPEITITSISPSSGSCPPAGIK